mmetsp:Transcript_72390/g.88794  ORF Transcript_72390/g.88794 Transcript_72390/m.88794 type:complete len:169 (-) Transcript_72390:71-577(-)
MKQSNKHPSHEADQRRSTIHASGNRHSLKEFMDLQIKIKYSSIILIICGLVFWIWGIINSFTGVCCDGGIAIFMFPIIGGIVGLITSKKSTQTIFMYPKAYYILAIFGTIIPVIGFIIGITLGITWKDNIYIIYCSSMTLLWIIIMLFIIKYSKKWYKMANQRRIQSK